MLVLDPIPVVIDNLPDDYIEMIELPFSKDPAFGVCNPEIALETLANGHFLVSLTQFPLRRQFTLIAAISVRRPRRTSSGLQQEDLLGY
jgi:hypothetical protein